MWSANLFNFSEAADGKTQCPVPACSKRVDAKRSAMRDHLLGHLNDPTRMPYKCSERNCFYACVRADAIRDHVKVCGKNKRKKWTAEEEVHISFRFPSLG